MKGDNFDFKSCCLSECANPWFLQKPCAYLRAHHARTPMHTANQSIIAEFTSGRPTQSPGTSGPLPRLRIPYFDREDLDPSNNDRNSHGYGRLFGLSAGCGTHVSGLATAASHFCSAGADHCSSKHGPGPRRDERQKPEPLHIDLIHLYIDHHSATSQQDSGGAPPSNPAVTVTKFQEPAIMVLISSASDFFCSGDECRRGSDSLSFCTA